MKAEDFIKKVMQDEKARAVMSLALGIDVHSVLIDIEHHFEKIVGVKASEIIAENIMHSITDEGIKDAKEVIEKLKTGTL